MYLNYINNFRGIAILFIVFSHTIKLVTENMEPIKEQLLRTIAADGTVLFVFISGFLFQHLSNKFEYKKYLKSKLRNVVTPYLIVSIPAIIYTISSQSFRYDFIGDFMTPIQVIILYLTGSHLPPYWFFPMIFIFYIISPILIKLDRWKYFYYFLPLLLLVSTFVSRAPLGETHINFFHFLGVYVFGMFFSRYKDKLLSTIKRNRSSITLLFFVIFTLSFLNRYTDFVYSPLDDNLFLDLWSKLMLTAILIYLLYKYDHIIQKHFNLLATYSFGIFFIHEYLIMVLNKISQTINLPYNDFVLLIIFFILFSAIIIICIITIYIIKRIVKKNSRMIIGS